MRRFLRTEASSGAVLLAAAIVALLWANAPFSDSYESLWSTELNIAIGNLELPGDLRHWINDGLMTLFFFVVALEIKRELVSGELSDVRKALLPIVAAVGGMVGPALIYIALNAGSSGEAGWGIPMATDIAFAVAVLALFSDRIPSGIRIFLLSLAIVDDIGAIVVIALFYSGGIEAGWLLAAIGLLVSISLLKKARFLAAPAYVLIGTAVWLATLQSGIHATIAGVALGFLAPVRSDALERRLHPWTSLAVVPIFALANAGVSLNADSLGDALGSKIALGIIVGLVVGKAVGITLASWLAVRLNVARLPQGVRWGHLVGASLVAGIGFTVSIFIAGLAFEDPGLVTIAKVGILFGSLAAGLIGSAALSLGANGGVLRDH
jgi:Na+:H+ antiporter, NhaA family